MLFFWQFILNGMFFLINAIFMQFSEKNKILEVKNYLNNKGNNKKNILKLSRVCYFLSYVHVCFSSKKISGLTQAHEDLQYFQFRPHRLPPVLKLSGNSSFGSYFLLNIKPSLGWVWINTVTIHTM